ncbi:hypothetical protein, partial [Actinoplanes sp. GCM10030250]|uniref:hypothetical protein n=1 Tax=Actinoplanes sp. GCM10030250 TaxID=3273376 RepID=UPI003607E532
RDENGAPQICGNVVYVNVEGGGRLPKYCGGEEQGEWQERHGTAGNARHRSELAAYPRKQLGLSAKEVEQLAAEEAARQGIGGGIVRARSEALRSAPAPVAAAVEPVAVTAPESAAEGLADLARIITSRVTAVRAEMDDVVAQADSRVAEADGERERLAEEIAAEREALAVEREEARAITARAEAEIRAANDARLH